MSQVTGAKESTVGETEDTNKERVIGGSQECLLPSSDEGSEGLKNFLRGELDSLSGERLERIVELDPTVVLELWMKIQWIMGVRGVRWYLLTKKCPGVVWTTFYVRS